MSAGLLLSPPESRSAADSPPLVKPCVPRRVRSPIISATRGDHSAIYCFLTGVLGPPHSRAEFKAALEDPFYEPCDRLLLRRNGQIYGHVHLTHRVVQFGSVPIPVAGLDRLAIDPQRRGRGLGMHLLQAAEQRMLQDGAVLGLLRTSIPHFFRRTGWALCGRPSYRAAGARALLAQLLDYGIHQERQRRFQIRPWRRWEEAGLMRIYDENRAGSFGFSERSRAYWQWLLRRHAYDQLYVALQGSNLWNPEVTDQAMVGYAAIQGDKIVELMTVRGRERAAARLLARVCGDAIEHDRQNVVLHAPPGSRLFRFFDQARGSRPEGPAERGAVSMARLLDPRAFLRLLCGPLQHRAEQAGLPRPMMLGLLVEGRKYKLEITRQGIAVSTNHVSRNYLRLNVCDFTRLLLGQLDYEQALAEGRLEASTAFARDSGAVLFPHLPLWRPPWDDLPA